MENGTSFVNVSTRPEHTQFRVRGAEPPSLLIALRNGRPVIAVIFPNVQLHTIATRTHREKMNTY